MRESDGQRIKAKIFNLSEQEVEKIIDQCKEKKILKSMPAHFSRYKDRALLGKRYGSDFIKSSVDRVTENERL